MYELLFLFTSFIECLGLCKWIGKKVAKNSMRIQFVISKAELIQCKRQIR